VLSCTLDPPGRRAGDVPSVSEGPIACERREERGPFDIIGDVHGCYDELVELLGKLGYRLEQRQGAGPRAYPPPGRKAVFVGDLVDRGPDVAGVLELVMAMVEAGQALAVLGNHDYKLLRALRGRNVKIAHGLQHSLQQLGAQPAGFRAQVADFLAGLPTYYILDEGRLVVAHAGLKEELQGKASARARGFALFGETTGETDAYGLPVRLDWAQHYHGRALVVHGHVAVLEPRWVNNTIDIDTGCVFGGALTALRYPELELFQVPAHRTYYEPIRPLGPPVPMETQAEHA